MLRLSRAPGATALRALTLVALLVGAGATADQPARVAVASAPGGGTLRTAFDADFSTLDPAVGYDPFAWTGEHAIFEGLLDYAPASGVAGTRLVPRLAAALPTVSKDGLLYTFTLRHGVHFQAPVNRLVTADDVRYSIERALSPRTANAAMNGSPFFAPLQGTAAFWAKKASHISGISVTGGDRISFRLTAPDQAFLNVLTLPFSSVVPREWVQKWGAAFSDHALGTGPFVLRSWAHGRQMVLARNPGYYRPGVPLVDQVTIDFNVSDHLQVQRVQAGALDVGGNLVTAADFLSLKNDSRWSKNLTSAPDIAVNYLAFNLTKAPFKGNLKLRQAINMAIDKRFLLRLLNGRGIAMNGILPPTMPGADAHFSTYAYDPGKATALLKAAGYQPGQLSIPLTYQQSGDFDKVAQEIQSELGSIGIKVTLKPVSSSTWYGGVAYNAGKEGAMVLAPWGQDYPDPSDFFDPILTCGSGSNAAFYCNHAVDALANAARGTTNRAKRYALYRQMEKLVMADAPWAPLYDGVLYDFHASRLQHFYIPPVWPFDYASYAVAG
jgi:ABC-type transport system substrate-binding protein